MVNDTIPNETLVVTPTSWLINSSDCVGGSPCTSLSLKAQQQLRLYVDPAGGSWRGFISGAGTGVSGQVAGFVPVATSPTSLAPSNCDDGHTTLNVFTCVDSGGGAFIGGMAVNSNPPPVTRGTAGGAVGACGTPPAIQPGSTAWYVDANCESDFAVNGTVGSRAVRRTPSPVHSTGNTASISTATLCSTALGNCDGAGQYHVHFDFINTGTACTNVTAGSVGLQLTWTDTNGTTHSAVQVPMMTQASATALAGTMVFVANNLSAWGSGDITISTNGSVIQYATNYTGCTTGTGTYQLDASVTRIQ
jgi:hypothetical protein